MTTTEPMPIAEVSAEDRTLYARIAPDLCSLIYNGDLDGFGEMQAIARHRLTALADAERKLVEARGLLQPFADAAEDLDEKHGDGSDIWEAPAGMSITAGNLRDAAAFLAAQDGGKG